MQITCVDYSGAAACLEEYSWDLHNAIDAVLAGEWSNNVNIDNNVDIYKLSSLFENYLEPGDPDTMEIDGIAKFCEDIDVSPEDSVSIHFLSLLAII